MSMLRQEKNKKSSKNTGRRRTEDEVLIPAEMLVEASTPLEYQNQAGPLKYESGQGTSWSEGGTCNVIGPTSATEVHPEDGLNWWRVQFADGKPQHLTRLDLFNRHNGYRDRLDSATVWFDPTLQADDEEAVDAAGAAEIGKELYAKLHAGNLEAGKDYVQLGAVASGQEEGTQSKIGAAEGSFPVTQPVKRVYVLAPIHRLPASPSGNKYKFGLDKLTICGALLYAPAWSLDAENAQWLTTTTTSTSTAKTEAAKMETDDGANKSAARNKSSSPIAAIKYHHDNNGDGVGLRSVLLSRLEAVSVSVSTCALWSFW
ncbi:unnamed protein product [Amoebophrya sp. A120]|nr:unnamed protein product [Amoebophrya sp. A120]|eukprot:GSA120T00008838001.1